MLLARITIYGLLTGLLLVGCVSRSPLTRPLPTSVAVDLPDNVRIRTQDGRTLELRHAYVENDSVIGFVPLAYGARRSLASGRYPYMTRHAVALQDVRTIERQHTSAAKTIGLALGLGLVAATIVIAIGFSQWSMSGPL